MTTRASNPMFSDLQTTMNQASPSLDAAVAESLTKFVHAWKDENWIGREREAVSAYVMGFLAGSVKPGTVLSALEQIGIEVGVPQLPGANRKKVVCKDLVIWSAPRMICWDSDGSVRRYPIAIMEWKTRSEEVFAGDVEWLREYSKPRHEFVGYAVCLRPSNAGILVDRVSDGLVKERWLEVIL